jgi:hypothetical protein
MGYMHIDNLYKNQTILLFRECFALEKIHGTSAHVTWREGKVIYFSGGASHVNFCVLFDDAALRAAFETLGYPNVTVYGEAYGGKEQGQAWRYGHTLKFVVFEVQVGDTWLSVPNAVDVAQKLGLEFVSYVQIPTDIDSIDGARDAVSVQATRNGMGSNIQREGIVLRPLVEVWLSNGERIIAKHKRDEERETATPRVVADPARLEALTKADEIATEWVTPTRLEHVLAKLPQPVNIEHTRQVITAMLEDVTREGAGEFADSREARGAISRKTADLFKAKLKAALWEVTS